MGKRKEYTAEYKTKLVLEVLREEKTMSEIASREGIGLNQLSNWKREFLDNAAMVFSRNRDAKDVARQAELQKQKELEVQAKIGQLLLENDFLKKSCEKLLGPGWEAKNGY